MTVERKVTQDKSQFPNRNVRRNVFLFLQNKQLDHKNVYEMMNCYHMLININSINSYKLSVITNSYISLYNAPLCPLSG